jgi:mono/diheme cytochrome c family protein
MMAAARILLLWWLVAANVSTAADIDFVSDVRPIFEKHCYGCHGPSQQKSGLRLDMRQAAFRGGDSHGASIVPGNAMNSPLVRLIRSKDLQERMPPKGPGLSQLEMDILEQWIDAGAQWPDGIDLAHPIGMREHWSFKPMVSPNSITASNPTIDSFIDAKLAEHELQRSPPATPATWLRRVSLDLTGLPPTPDELQSFEQQSPPNFQAAVERLLSSPRYGERWAQHWLDVVRYADTHGFEVNTERPNAWPYRDYVIRAFNSDVPYHQFVKEQLVGDAMGEDAARQDSLDEMVNNISQTFLGLSVGCARCHDHKFDPISQHDYYAMQTFVAGVEYEDREMNTPQAQAQRTLAITLRDQIENVDEQLANLAPLAHPNSKPATLNASDNGQQPLRTTVSARINIDRVMPTKAKRLRFTILATNSLEPCLDELEVINASGVNVALADYGTKLTTSGDTRVEGRHAPHLIHDGRYGNESSWMSNEPGKGWVEFEFPNEEQVVRIAWSRDRAGKFEDRLPTDYQIELNNGQDWGLVADSTDRRPFVAGTNPGPTFSTAGLSPEDAKTAGKLLQQRSKLDADIRRAEIGQRVFAGRFRAPDAIHLLSRGDPEQPKDQVLPATLSLFGSDNYPSETNEQERRKLLAHWIVDPTNPLTARVMANRIWQWHFGVGLVSTPSDLGRNGSKPTHPELLDWLATEFVKNNWSIKHMHRMIVLSETYRQSSQLETKAYALDSESKWLWRFPLRRLEAEAIRDSMLFVSGQLNLKMHGPGFDLFDQRGGLSGFKPVESFQGEGLRRMIYAHKVRREREAIFGAFDCPDAGQSTATRRESTTPIQSLNLLNSRFTLEAAQAFATRIRQHSNDEVQAQIDCAFQFALGRHVSETELQELEPLVRQHGVAELCRALFNCNEFLYLP